MKHAAPVTIVVILLLGSVARVEGNSAVALNPGDIIVTETSGGDRVIKVDPVTGFQTVLSQGGFFLSPQGLTVDANGDILVADPDAIGRLGGIIRVDPATGIQSVVSSGGLVSTAFDVAIDANGDLLVVNIGGSLVRVDPTTGAQSMVSQGGQLTRPTGLAIEANGDVLIVNIIPGSLIRVDLTTGAQSVVSQGGFFDLPVRVAVEAAGDALVVDMRMDTVPPANSQGGVIRVDPTTGNQTVVSSHGVYNNPQAIAVEDDRNIIVADSGAFGFGAILRVDPATGAQSLVSDDDQFASGLRGVTIVGSPLLAVAIDIKPGSDPNSINVSKEGFIAVAILTISTADGEPIDFDAGDVDPSSVAFGPSGASIAHSMAHLEDVDGDGDLDLLLHFRTQETGIPCSDTEASLVGETFDGTPIEGSDSIRTVGCKP